jgi:hypothetical protein
MAALWLLVGGLAPASRLPSAAAEPAIPPYRQIIRAQRVLECLNFTEGLLPGTDENYFGASPRDSHSLRSRP